MIYKQKRDFYCISDSQLSLFNILKRVFPDAELEFKIGGRIKKKGLRVKWADIGIPSLKLDFEYDGHYHRTSIFTDLERDNALTEYGWKVFRVKHEDLSILDNISKNVENSSDFINQIEKILEKNKLKNARVCQRFHPSPVLPSFHTRS